VIFLLVLVILLFVTQMVVVVGYLDLYHRHKNQSIILSAIHATEDLGYILSEILTLMKRVLRIPVAEALVTIAEESQLRVVFPTEISEKGLSRFFASMSRSEMYQFLLQCFSVTKNIFVTNVIGPTSDSPLIALSIFQRFQNRHRSHYNYLIVPVYDKEIVGLVVLEALRDTPFSYRAVKRLQKSIPLLNIAFSRVLLLWNLRQQSITDPLTGVLNKRQFLFMAEKFFSLTKRRGQPFALAVLDIDHFKEINDHYGHHVGDMILKDVAAMITRVSRQSDYLFRVGGDEFCILFSEIPGVEEIQVYSDRIYEALKEYDHQKPSVVREPITVSFGWAMEQEASSWVEVFEKADRHMYEQKRKHHENRWYQR